MARPTKEKTRKSLFGLKLESLMLGEKKTRFCEFFNIGTTALSKYLNGDTTPSMEKIQEFVLNYAASNGQRLIDLNWLVNDFDRRLTPVFTGQVIGPRNAEYQSQSRLDALTAPPNSRRMKIRKRSGKVEWWESNAQSWEVRGSAAANSVQGAAGDPGYAAETVDPPDGVTLVLVEGDSMYPLLMDGQYAIIDKNRIGFEVNGGIVVVVTMENGEYLTRIKRCYKHGDTYEFRSINKLHAPFESPISECQMWPVIGIWFADKGQPPMED